MLQTLHTKSCKGHSKMGVPRVTRGPAGFAPAVRGFDWDVAHSHCLGGRIGAISV